MIDVVDDDPQNRWLSVCFYAHLVTDPEEKWRSCASRTFGEDAICFNLDEDDEAMRSYIKTRLKEAVQNTKINQIGSKQGFASCASEGFETPHCNVRILYPAESVGVRAYSA